MTYNKKDMCDMRTGAYDTGKEVGFKNGFWFGTIGTSITWFIILLIVL